jgi:hypothetical protein
MAPTVPFLWVKFAPEKTEPFLVHPSPMVEERFPVGTFMPKPRSSKERDRALVEREDRRIDPVNPELAEGSRAGSTNGLGGKTLSPFIGVEPVCDLAPRMRIAQTLQCNSPDDFRGCAEFDGQVKARPFSGLSPSRQDELTDPLAGPRLSRHRRPDYWRGRKNAVIRGEVLDQGYAELKAGRSQGKDERVTPDHHQRVKRDANS